MDIGMNTEFKVRLTPKDEKAVYSQSLPMTIHLKEDLIVELALMHKYGIITVLPFSKYASPIFAQRKRNRKIHLLVDLRKINTIIADDYTNNIHQSALCQTQHNTWQGNPYSASLTALRLIIACRWRTNVRLKCFHLIFLAKQLTTKTITAFVDQVSEWNTTGTVTPLENFTETASLILSHSLSAITDRQTDNSQSNQHNGITLYNQQEHRNCRVLRSHSGAIQVNQTSTHGNPWYDS